MLSGFNDIFVSIAVLLVLAAVGWIGQSITTPLARALVATTAWGLAEYFTRARRMALPSILLMLAFVGGVAAMLVGVMVELHPDLPGRIDAVIGAGIGLVAVGAAWLHWRRFMVPITVAAGAASLVGVVIGLAIAAVPAAKEAIFPILLPCGLGVFALATLGIDCPRSGSWRSRENGRPRKARGRQSTTFINRRSTGASTGPRSCPRFNITPCSPTSAHMPCLLRKAGRFSIRNSGRSAARRKAAKIAASCPSSIA